MSLKVFQSEIDSETLYAVAEKQTRGTTPDQNSALQLRPTIQIVGAAGTVYGSQVLPDSPPTNMTAMFSALEGIAAFDYIPNYLYVEPDGDPLDTIVLSAVSAEEV